MPTEIATAGQPVTLRAPLPGRWTLPGRGDQEGLTATVTYNNPGIRTVTVKMVQQIELNVRAAPASPEPAVQPGELRKITATAGQPVTMTVPVPGKWTLPNREVPDGTSARVTYSSPGIRMITVEMVMQIQLDVKAAPPPPPPPLWDVEIRPGDNITSKLNGAGSGTIADPVRVGIHPGVYTGSIRLSTSHVFIGAVGAAPTIQGACSGGGTAITNVTIKGLNFTGPVTTTYGLDFVFTAAIDGLTFEDCTVTGFGGGARFQHANNTSATPFSAYAKNISLRRCRLKKPLSTDSHGGHNIFVCNVNGFTLEECFLDGAGRAKNSRGLFVHGLYSKEGNRRVIVRRNFVNDSENFGIQTRGPTWTWNAPDTGDIGPVVEDNVVYDCVGGIAVDGIRARVVSNVIGALPFHTGSTWKHGRSGVYGSVGTLNQGNNLRFMAAGQPNRTDGWTQEAWRNDDRDDDVWCWRGACNTVVPGAADVDALTTKTKDLSDLVTRLRAGDDIGTIVRQAQERVRA